MKVKKKYLKPQMTRIGSFIQITQGTGSKPGDAGNLQAKSGGGN